MAHVEEQALLEFTLGQLEGEAGHAVERHLAECEVCRERQKNISSAAFSKTAVGSSKDGEPTRADGPAGAAQLTLQRGATLGRYVVLEKLGAGGMGEVFAAYDPTLDRKVALKLLRGGALSAEEGKARLLREAQAMARLQHPNVIAVHDVGVFGERVFVAMEYVDGETLGDWLRARRRWEDVVAMFLRAGDGLAAAHRAGLVHRDFKSDNVLIGSDARPRVLDFGLARQTTGTPPPQAPGAIDAPVDQGLAKQLTRDGAVMGTPGYMAPEQIHGLPTDARSDQFSFCVALWEGLFGVRPFSGSTLKQHAAAIATGSFTPLPSDTQVPSWVVEVLKRGLANDPAQRWPGMDELLRALRPRRKRNPRRVLFVTGLVLFSIFGIGYGLWTRQRLLVCGGSERELVGLWDPQRKAKLGQGFTGTGLSYAGEAWTNTARALDAWAAEYVATSREVCEAARLRKVDSPELTELKTACLEERVQELSALVSLFDTPDHDVVNNAPLAARELQRPGTCSGGQGLHKHGVIDEAEKLAETKLQKQLMEARALYAAGKYAAGAARLNEGIPPTAPPSSQAEAYLWLARIEVRLREDGLERQANLNAATQALKSGDPSLIARSFSRLQLNAVTSDDASATEGEAWGRLAAAAAARVPGDWEVQVELAKNEGFVDLRKKRFKPALANLERALELQRKHLGDEHPEVASTLTNLGTVLTKLERYDEALERYEEGLRLHATLEGMEHPNVALATQNLGVTLRMMGRPSEARVAFERALAIRRKALGFNHRDTLSSAHSLVKLLVVMGELEPARTLLDEVKDATATVSGPDSAEMMAVLETETELLLAGEFWREALASATRHLELAKARGPAGVKATSAAMLEQVQAWTQLGAWNDARKTLMELERRQLAGDAGVVVAELTEQLGRFELAQGHAENAASRLTLAVELRQKDPSATARIPTATAELALAQALIAAGKPGEAVLAAESAEGRLGDAGNAKLLLEAQVLKVQAQLLAEPQTRAASAELLVALMPQLPEARRSTLTQWLEKQGVSSRADAGTP